MRGGRSILDYFARIAVCAVLVVTTSLGQWLHHLQYHTADQQCSESGDSSNSVGYQRHLCGHTHHRPRTTCDTTEAERDEESPNTPHDHNSCRVCDVLAQAASSPAMVSIPTVTVPPFEHLQVDSEVASPAVVCSPIARGPPAESADHC